MPGGGFGIFNGCTQQWGTPSTSWGSQYGGVSSRSMCDAFPAPLKAGCYWRYDWFKDADNPSVSFKQVACPAALTAKTGCVRADDTPTGPVVVPTAGSGSGSTAAGTKPATSSSVSPTSGTGPVVQKYGQCGGIGWTGGTTCVAGTTCKVSNAYYSQCL